MDAIPPSTSNPLNSSLLLFGEGRKAPFRNGERARRKFRSISADTWNKAWKGRETSRYKAAFPRNKLRWRAGLLFRRWTAEGKSRPPPLLGFKERETFRRHGWKPPKKQNWPGHAAVFQQQKIRFKACSPFFIISSTCSLFLHFPHFPPPAIMLYFAHRANRFAFFALQIYRIFASTRSFGRRGSRTHPLGHKTGKEVWKTRTRLPRRNHRGTLTNPEIRDARSRGRARIFRDKEGGEGTRKRRIGSSVEEERRERRMARQN